MRGVRLHTAYDEGASGPKRAQRVGNESRVRHKSRSSSDQNIKSQRKREKAPGPELPVPKNDHTRPIAGIPDRPPRARGSRGIQQERAVRRAGHGGQGCALSRGEAVCSPVGRCRGVIASRNPQLRDRPIGPLTRSPPKTNPRERRRGERRTTDQTRDFTAVAPVARDIIATASARPPASTTSVAYRSEASSTELGASLRQAASQKRCWSACMMVRVLLPASRLA